MFIDILTLYKLLSCNNYTWYEFVIKLYSSGIRFFWLYCSTFYIKISLITQNKIYINFVYFLSSKSILLLLIFCVCFSYLQRFFADVMQLIVLCDFYISQYTIYCFKLFSVLKKPFLLLFTHIT